MVDDKILEAVADETVDTWTAGPGHQFHPHEWARTARALALGTGQPNATIVAWLKENNYWLPEWGSRVGEGSPGPLKPEPAAEGLRAQRYRQRLATVKEAMLLCGAPVLFKWARVAQLGGRVAELALEAARGVSVLCLGVPGVGKSHWSVAALAERLRAQAQELSRTESLDVAVDTTRPDYLGGCQWLGFASFLGKLKRTYDSRDERFDQVMEKYVAAPWLCLDDVGAGERLSHWSSSIAHLVIDERLNRELPTVITTNLSLDDLAVRLGDEGPRIMSRLQQWETVTMAGKDRRARE